MGQRPHPFTHKFIDRTDGAFLTSGRDCYTNGGVEKTGNCKGVFRAKKAGLYTFSLIGTQMLVNSKRSHFTGWIKKNGMSLAGSYSNAGDVSTMIESGSHWLHN